VLHNGGKFFEFGGAGCKKTAGMRRPQWPPGLRCTRWGAWATPAMGGRPPMRLQGVAEFGATRSVHRLVQFLHQRRTRHGVCDSASAAPSEINSVWGPGLRGRDAGSKVNI
jgi:hypothetical protein